MNLWQDEIPAFVPASYRVKRAQSRFELLGHQRLRHGFFCNEQRMFQGSDRDEIDAVAIPVVAVSYMAGDFDEVVGTVRIHQESAGLWWGSRLCVAPELRGVASLGAALISHAVATARGDGCTRFSAHVQMQNVPLFRSLGWQVEQETILHGRHHVRMRADLNRFPKRPTRITMHHLRMPASSASASA